MEEGGLKYSNTSLSSSSSSVSKRRDLMKGERSQSHHFHFHLHLPHIPLSLPLHMSLKRGGGEELYKDVPKGCLAVYVGQGQQQQRFVIPVVYVNHPLFEKLLKEAEEEYGFEQKGTITIPCQVSVFQYVQDLIHREQHRCHTHGGCFR